MGDITEQVISHSNILCFNFPYYGHNGLDWKSQYLTGSLGKFIYHLFFFCSLLMGGTSMVITGMFFLPPKNLRLHYVFTES